MTSPRAWRAELAIVVALAVSSGAWATHFWNRWTAHGGQPVFYQAYFEPAVMIACGRGFVISKHQPKRLEDFLFLRADTFKCADLPEHLELDPDHVYQGAWLYLETTVGWAWRVLGISWSGMGPLFGLLFGIDIALAYAICRLGARRGWAMLAAASLAISSTQLVNLPHLRDYAKAPFTLGLVLIVGLVVTRPVRRRTLLLLAAAYGVVLGVGYGFRTDFLVDLPVLVIALFAFLEGGITRHLKLKAAATLVLLATFFVVSWPISSAVYTRGGCQWHVALLGLQPNSSVDLHLTSTPYDIVQTYADGYIDLVVNGYARRMQPGRPPMVFCSHEYDVQSGRYLRDIAMTFPADMAIRAYASMIQIVELPFRHWTSPPMEGWFPRLYRARALLVRPGDQWGTYLTVASVLMVSMVSLRLGLFLVFFLAYFGGYPAIQFQERHYFHLEFMGWWAFAFVACQTITIGWSWRAGVPDLRSHVRAASRGAALVLAGGVALVLVLGGGRWYQERQVRRLFNAYIAAPKVRLTNTTGSLRDVAHGEWPQLLEVDLNAAACGPGQTITFRYEPTIEPEDLTRTITLGPPDDAAGPTRIFLPVFERFTGIETPGARPNCVAGAYRFPELSRFRLLLGATLPPDWESTPLYQRLGT